MDSSEVEEIKRHFSVATEGLDAKIDRIADGLQGQIRQVAEAVSAVDSKIDREVAEVKRHFGVVAEGLQGQVRQVAEAVSAVDSKIDREIGGLRGEMRSEFADTRAMIRFSHAELDSRVRRLEEKKG